MAVPKKRTTRGVQGQRRSHDALVVTSLTSCTNCGQMIKPHTVCTNCGMYRGKKLLKV